MRTWLVEYRGTRTQEEVARACGIHRGYYSLLETDDRRRPSVQLAKRIGAYLGFDWTRFYEDECVDSLQDHSA